MQWAGPGTSRQPKGLVPEGVSGKVSIQVNKACVVNVEWVSFLVIHSHGGMILSASIVEGFARQSFLV